MEIIKGICFMSATILGIIFLILFLITDDIKYGIWVLIMGQVIIKLK